MERWEMWVESHPHKFPNPVKMGRIIYGGLMEEEGGACACV